MKFIINLIAVAYFTLFVFTAVAQSSSQPQYFTPQPFPRSPAATGIEKYGTYRVSEFSGLPDISIPLYTIEAGGLQVPVTLSYHASGIKVTEVASWVGLGWSVSSGGQITRKAMALPDDGVNGYLYNPMWQPGTGALYTSTLNGIDSLENIANGTYDGRPDIFSYDINGRSGKFFFDGRPGQNFAVRLIPYTPIRINKTLITYAGYNPPPNTGITKLNIIDEHGNAYYFGEGSTDVTYSSSAAHPGVTMASAWKVVRMISQNKRDSILFSYTNDKINYPAADGEFITVIDQVQKLDERCTYNWGYTNSPITPGNVNIVTEQLPSQINFKNGKVVFDLDTAVRQDVNMGGANNAHRLKDIKVFKFNYATKLMELQKTIVFYSSYFPSNSKRLELDSIQIQDKAGSIIQHYSFDYNKTVTLPDYSSYSQDYWGYFNGKANNMLTPSQHITYATVPGSVQTIHIGGNIANGRDCDSTQMQVSVLTAIHYPTGGYSTFTYQTNQYYDSNDTLRLAGGLRIKTISSYDGTGAAPVLKTYIYNRARPNFFLDNSYFVNSQTHRQYSGSRDGFPTIAGTEMVRTFTSNPHCDLEAWDGATVVYPSVTEYIGSPAANTGRTDYYFTDIRDSISSVIGSQVYNSMFYARGQLAAKKVYMIKSDKSYQIVRATNNTYSAFPYTNYNNVGYAIQKIFYNEGAAGNPIEPNAASPDDSQSFLLVNSYYHILSDDNYLTSSVTKNYDINDTTKYTTSAVNYKYDNITHQQVTRSYHTDSKGNTIITRNRYPADYATGNSIIDTMVNRNMQAELIEKYDTLKNVNTGLNAITGAQLNKYKLGGDGTSIVPSTISTLSVANPLTNFTPSTVSSGNLTNDSRYAQMISFDQYDYQNNILKYTPRNATATSILWDYQGELPVAQIRNANMADVHYTNFETSSFYNINGWYYPGVPVNDPTAPMGSLCYPLGSGNITSPALDNSKSYVLSLWSKGSAPTVTYSSTSFTATSLRSANGWTYYEYLLPSGTSQLTISGTTSIDELRLFPSSGQLTTYAYSPDGLTDIMDPKGTISQYEYDPFQRLKNVKDWVGNIVKSYKYHTYDQTVGNDAVSVSVTRNNCPQGSTGGALTYTVPLNKYYSSTKPSANAEATYEANSVGQSKANSNCSCTVQTAGVIFSNTTGYSFTAQFTGTTNAVYNFPLNGSTTLQVPLGSYSVYIGPVGSGTHTFSYNGQTVSNAHSATFQVSVNGTYTNLSIQ